MGGGKSSFFCPIFSFLRKSRRYYDDDMSDWDGRTGYVRKVRSSDDDYGWWVGERDVDRKASDFINNYHPKKVAA
ncbi:hypothetical protein PR202_gb08912 [Eleusine coracana subsp. coracana]|uniref:Uncharacterized protein n=1 Tax=Eleusine coracana subsp. coracana TaxID=191504 RepID=A0AAV5EFL0_ELECO|nr:hypothetical protein QOZ80_2BG0190970 [Eleusine coracana subsp. coracana]GJN21440.1 hypothetical protein PR202_gb08912 [Eleusine coracana subsp. coracana]